MENEQNCANYGMMEITSSNCYFHPNWDNTTTTNNTSIDQNDPLFESVLSSIVSSPTAATAPPTSSNGGGDGMMIRELIGRLGSICDSGEVSPQSCIATVGNNNHNNNNNSSSTNNSCYSTPMNSPPSKFNLSSLMMINNHNSNYPIQQNLGSLNADPGFVERAAKFSCFGNNNNVRNIAEFDINYYNDGGNNDNNRSVAKLENGKLSRVNSEKKMGENNNGELGDSREGSSVSEQNPGAEIIAVKAQQNDANSRKRKSVSKPKIKETSSKDDKVEVENEESNAKRSKVEEKEAKKENNGEESNKEASKPEPPKDYIHVRARRGQATDSHSLAERVRREKISERMKFLQDLVPGCNKVTGKATVLDEIINYVQSLQRQVEFLSMKLATVNPRMEFNMEALLSKEMFQTRGSSMQQTMYSVDQNSAQAFPYGYQSNQQLSLPMPNGAPNGIENHFPVHPMNGGGIRRNPGVPLPLIDGFVDPMTQMPNLWEDDLQSLVQMGIVQNQTQNVPAGTIPNAQMKVEL